MTEAHASSPVRPLLADAALYANAAEYRDPEPVQETEPKEKKKGSSAVCLVVLEAKAHQVNPVFPQPLRLIL